MCIIFDDYVRFRIRYVFLGLCMCLSRKERDACSLCIHVYMFRIMIPSLCYAMPKCIMCVAVNRRMPRYAVPCLAMQCYAQMVIPHYAVGLIKESRLMMVDCRQPGVGCRLSSRGLGGLAGEDGGGGDRLGNTSEDAGALGRLGDTSEDGRSGSRLSHASKDARALGRLSDAGEDGGSGSRLGDTGQDARAGGS